MSYQTGHRSISSKKSTALQKRIHALRDCYKVLTKKDKDGATLVWGSIVPPLFVPVPRGGHFRVLETAIIGEKNPAHLYTRILEKVVS